MEVNCSEKSEEPKLVLVMINEIQLSIQMTVMDTI